MNDPVIPTILDSGGDPSATAKKGSFVPRPMLIESWNTLRRYKWSILIVVSIGTLIGYQKATTEIPIYKASLTLLIEPNRPKGTVEEIVSRFANPYKFYQTQSQIIRSRAIAEIIAQKLDPDRYQWATKKSEPDLTATLVESFKGLIGQQRPVIKQAVVQDELVDGRAVLVNAIKNRIQVDGGNRSQIIGIGFTSHDPEFAAAVVNAAADAYIELSLDARLSAAKVANSWLTRQIEDLRKKVSESEARLQSYQIDESLVDTEKLSSLTSGRLEALNDDYSEAQAKLSSLSKRYGSKHPAIAAAKAELAEIRQRLEAEKGNAVESQSKGFALAKLERDVATYRQLYDQFLTRFKETDLAMQYDINDVRVIDRAEVPGAPISPNKRKIVTTWILLGLIVGILLAWLRDFLDNTFKSPQDIENLMALPVIGVVPYIDSAAKKKSGGGKYSKPERFYVSNNKSGFAESINHIRTGVLFTNVDNPPKVIMVTSALQSEGKTTLCTNLALAFGQLSRTLLLDADLRKPRVAQIAGLDTHGGVADVVAGRAKVVDSFVRDPDTENLYIMKSGTQPPNPLELVSSEKFGKLVNELRSKFDHIIIDSPPILPVSDAIVLGRIADASLMVIRPEKTPKAASLKAVRSLRNADINLIGVALAQVTHKKTSYYYDGYYGYYGEYYGSVEPAPAQ